MNQRIEDAISKYKDSTIDKKKETCIAVLDEILNAIRNGNHFVLPVSISEEAYEELEALDRRNEEEATKEIHVEIRKLTLNDGTHVWPAFTSQEELKKGEETSAITDEIVRFLEVVLMKTEIDGVLINPWDQSFYLSKEQIKLIFEANLPVDRENIICIDTADITKIDIECIVNAANTSLLGGGGIDGAIHHAAGPQLLEECRTLNGCRTGEAKITKGYNLKAKHVIHTVGPIYSGSSNDAKLLRNCYWNSLELAREHDIHGIAFPAISTGVYGYPLKEATKIALQTVIDWLQIHPTYGMAVMMVCFDTKTKITYEQIMSEIEDERQEQTLTWENNGILEEAMKAAMDSHKGAVRKGSVKPYILHPIETLQILSAMDSDINLMAAGLLHDTLEDTEVNLLDIYDRFGVDVAALVYMNSEDKSQSWYMRKLHTVDLLQKVPMRCKMLLLADKVANLRSLYVDYKVFGEELWERFNAPKHMQAWYYGALNDGLAELQDSPETEDVYWEMTGLFKDLFVRYFVDGSFTSLYQIGDEGSQYILKKGNLQWEPFRGEIPAGLQQVSRKAAERMEDNWADSVS